MIPPYTPHVIVKFKDNIIPQVAGAAAHFLDQFRGTPEWDRLVAQFPGIDVGELITAVSETQLLALVDEARASHNYHPPNFLTYFAVPCPPNIDSEVVAQQIRLRFHTIAETVYVAGKPSIPPSVRNPGKNCAWARHDTDFLREAPAGIDAEYVWDKDKCGDGGKDDGINLQFVDIESDWHLAHPDLTDRALRPNIDFVPGRNDTRDYTINHKNSKNHGTGVLGIVAALDNTVYSIGVVPNVSAIKVASKWKALVQNPDPNNPLHWSFDPVNAILAAIYTLQSGDVLLLEMQIDQDRHEHLPVEYDQHLFHYIQLGTALGRVIVEAAGNGQYDLDDFSRARPWLSRKSAHFEEKYDSGAIIVSAATPWVTFPDYIHTPVYILDIFGNPTKERAHNFGTRIDCYSWGDNTFAPCCYPLPNNAACDAAGTQILYENFGDTSGASAIIAGCALSVQAMAEKKRGNRLSPLELRKILSDPNNGTRSANDSGTGVNPDKIGVMPNLRAIYSIL